MADGAVLYLTKDETSRLFSKLPVSLQKEWKNQLKEEAIDAYETKEELMDRLRRPWRDDSKELKEFSKHIADIIEQGKGPDAVDLEKFPDTAFPHYFYSIGACGMSAMIQMGLQMDGLGSSDLKAIAGLSFIRHAILGANKLANKKI